MISNSSNTARESRDIKDIKLGNDYKVKLNTKIGNGSFGEIFKGINVKTNKEYAVKRESNYVTVPRLGNEAKFLKSLEGGLGIPNCQYYGTSGEHYYMVIDLLGANIETLFNQCKRSFSLKTLLMLADQMITRLKYIHSKHIIHRDIKPENFLIGLGENKDTVYMIDFGLARRYKDPKTGEHIPYKDGRPLIGTVRYISIYTHLGFEQSRRDDLESLGYVLVYLLRGSLPWQGLGAKNQKDKNQVIMEKKCSTGLDELCLDLVGFVNYFQYSKSLTFDDKPDYDYLSSLIENMLAKYNFEYDYNYDWLFIKSGDNKGDTASKDEIDKINKNKLLKVDEVAIGRSRTTPSFGCK